jgi:hypothetical protein
MIPGPTGKLVLNGGARFTRSSNVTASVATTAGAATQVCLSTSGACSAWMAWAPTVTFTLPSGDGSKLVNAWWKDARGNISAATATIVLDTTAPAGGTLGVKLTATQGTFSWAGVSDPGAGVAGYKLVVSETPVPAGCAGPAAYEGKDTMAVVKGLIAKETYYVRLCATDNIGNASAGFGGPFVMPAR